MAYNGSLRTASWFYSRIGKNGWTDSEYFTYSVRSPALRRWLGSQIPERKKILSVGCGTGELEGYLAQIGHLVVGLDLSRQMLRRARNGGANLLVQADSQSLPFEVDSFDIVLFAECVGHLNMPIAFKEAGRVLKKQGRLLITTYSGKVQVHDRYVKFPMAEISSSLSIAGFRIENHQFLHAQRNRVTEVAHDSESTLLHINSKKKSEPRQSQSARCRATTKARASI
jgi:SAM-dependent methyltransferase